MAKNLHLLVLALLAAALATAAPLFTSAAAAAQPPGLTRVSDLREHIGEDVTVRGRTGQIIETEETENVRVYTLRDDYGDMVRVRSSDDYPIMGATYDIAGTPQTDPETGNVYLEAGTQTKVYGGQATDVVITKTEAPRWLLPGVIGLILAGAVIVLFAVRNMLQEREMSAGLVDAWGFVEVVAGPHQGETFPLREDATVVGRHLDRLKAVSLDQDRSVSRNHGLLVRDDTGVYYVDNQSTNGSFIDEQQVAPQERLPIAPGAMLRIGPNTMLRIGRPVPEDADQTRGPNAEFTGEWGDAQTERAPTP